MKKYSMAFLWMVIVLMMCVPQTAKAASTLIQYDDKLYKYDRFPTLIINGKEMNTGLMPAVITPAHKALAPVRELFESIGATVDWDGDLEQVYIQYDNNILVLQVNSYVAYLNGEEYKLKECPKYMINKSAEKFESKTMVPIRFILELFNYEVGFDAEKYVITADLEKEEKPIIVEDTEAIVWENKNYEPTKPSELNTQLTVEKHSLTNITGVATVEASNQRLQYVIQADGPMSQVKTSTWNNVLIIDIVNSLKVFEEDSIPLAENPYFKQIRSSQFTENPYVTRVVFDMKYEDINYDLNFSEDRRQLYLTVGQNTISKIKLAQDEQGDYIDITGIQDPVLNVFWLDNPVRLVVDVPYTDSTLQYSETTANGQYVIGMRGGSKFDDSTTRLVLDLSERCEYYVENVRDGTSRIRLIKPTYQNVEVDYVGYPRLILRKPTKAFTAADIQFTDDYFNRKASFYIDSNKYKLAYGVGTISVNDDDIRNVELTQAGQGYQINISTKIIKGYTITEDDKYIYINIVTPKEAYGKVVVLDPGHGGSDPGKTKSQYNLVGKNEKTVNFDICQRIWKMFEANNNVKIYMTRLNDTRLELWDRTDMANEVEADLFLSVHNNALDHKVYDYAGLQRVKGMEVYYYSKDRASLNYAKVMHDAIIASNKSDTRGTRFGDYFVLRETKMLAVLIEVGFMTNQVDANRLNDDNFIQNTAQGMYNGLMKMLGY